MSGLLVGKVVLESQVVSGGTWGNGSLKLHKGRFRLDIGADFFTKRIVQHPPGHWWTPTPPGMGFYTFFPLLALKVFTAVFSSASQAPHILLYLFAVPQPLSVPWAVPEAGGCRDRDCAPLRQDCPGRGAVLSSQPSARPGFALQQHQPMVEADANPAGLKGEGWSRECRSSARAEQGFALGDQWRAVAGPAGLGLTLTTEQVQLLCCGCSEQTLQVPAQRSHTEFHLTRPSCPAGCCFRRQHWVHPSVRISCELVAETGAGSSGSSKRRWELMTCVMDKCWGGFKLQPISFDNANNLCKAFSLQWFSHTLELFLLDWTFQRICRKKFDIEIKLSPGDS